jgi:hypothetical protein
VQPKTLLFLAVLALGAVAFFLYERYVRVRVQKRLAARPKLSPTEFGHQYAPQSEAKAAVARRVRAVVDSVAETTRIESGFWRGLGVTRRSDGNGSNQGPPLHLVS